MFVFTGAGQIVGVTPQLPTIYAHSTFKTLKGKKKKKNHAKNGDFFFFGEKILRERSIF